MLYWLIVLIIFLALMVVSNYLLKWLRQHKIKIFRWIWAFASFLVVIIPKVIFPHMNSFWSAVIYILCGVFALNFMIEQHRWMVESKI
ncbi:diacylglycerol kinase [Lapidilactobacillus luobeiensis]|uniref:diacylglycerol kinase n=1 Tax=Lapidilactobacillus luobeiensis TaxID=2950371 RepID=UPI0021C44C89|nr:diacylglycerol kinase [Lapidilactobacillus luobeiensis]